MSQQNEVLDNADSAEARALDRFVSALDRGDIDELAAALGQLFEPAWPAPGRHRRPNESEQNGPPGPQ
ncbi:MAG: hypothetical protein QOH32_1600 [Bradyrhizobium sp.]|jgi:hypothetical protein|nr:hypothetical protein [Bradyrhizobium sp.]